MDRRWVRALSPLVLIAGVVFLAGLVSGCTRVNAANGVALAAGGAATTVAARGPDHVTLVVKTDVEHGKFGLDGLWHDAFLPAAFTAHVGVPVTVTVLNYDGGWHSFTAPELGLDVFLKAGRPAKPSVTTFTFTPKKAGTIPWFCKAPCDPWAMARAGYMQGEIQVVA